MNKQGKNQVGGIVMFIVAAVIGALIMQSGILGSFFGAAGGTPDQPISVDVTTTQRTAASTTLTAGPTEDQFTPTVAMDALEYHDIIVNGIRKGRYLDSDTLTVAPGDIIEGYYAINSSSYYARKFSAFEIPDTGAADTASPALGDSNKLCKGNTTWTLTWYDNNDQPLTTTTAEGETGHNITVTAGKVFNTYFKAEGTKDTCYSPYKAPLLVLGYNRTLIDDISVSKDGVKMKEGIVPTQHGVEAATRVAKAFVLDFTGNDEGLIDTDSAKFTITFELDDSLGANVQFINASFYDADYYRDSDTGEYVLGYEDNTDADVGEALKTEHAYTFTP